MILHKKSFILLIVFVIISFIKIDLNAQDRKFTIRGKFPYPYYDDLKVYLNEIDFLKDNKLTKVDSTRILNDLFVLKGDLKESSKLAYLTVEGMPEEVAIFMIEQGDIFLEFDSIPLMSGTPLNDSLRAFTLGQLKDRMTITRLLSDVQSKHKRKSLTKTDSERVEAAIEVVTENMDEDLFQLIKKNINNDLGQYFFILYSSYLNSLALEDIYNVAPNALKNHPEVKNMINKNRLVMGNMRVGEKFENSELIDINNKQVQIDSLINNPSNKVVLIDFWASWCQPCLKAIPQLKELYQKYHSLGFEIISISLDDSAFAWQNAIEKYNLSWPQLMGEKGGFNSNLAKRYKLSKIPQTYLLDINGNIIGIDLKKYKMEKTIQSILSDKRN